jgi:hypothetical protein
MNDEIDENNEGRIDIKAIEAEKKLRDLEELITENGILSYNAQCVRKKSNWSKSSPIFKFDDESFEPQTFLNNMPDYSPKLNALMKNIEELDKKDMRESGKLFKHFIFSDLKSSSYGAKLIASAFIAKGFRLGYHAGLKSNIQRVRDLPIGSPNTVNSAVSSISISPNNIRGGGDEDQEDQEEDDEEKEQEEKEDEEENEENPKNPIKNPNKHIKKRYQKIEMLEDQVLQNTKQQNFYILSSVGVYDQPINVITKKQILSKFNQRPENIHGELIRFIILDSGFKEGIDLFDIKYIHIFEPSTVPSDQKQVIGRGTRTCGQKGLEFHPTQGWTLHVFVYDLEFHDKLKNSFLGTKSAMELYLKSMDLDIRLLNFAHDLERTSIAGAVDHDLNVNVHSFSIPIVSINERNHHAVINEHVPNNTELIYGGVNKPKLIVRPGSPIVVNTSQHIQQQQPEPIEDKRLNYHDMKRFILENFGEFSWEPVTMENQCQDKQKGGSGEVIKYNPSQNFIRHYFQPLNPIKGMLLHHSTGSGKTCSAIAAATTNFEKNGYTILWVTRTTLKSDIWKNMFNQVCNESIRTQIENSGLKIPEDPKKRMRLLSKAWRIRPMSYKQFSNLILRQNVFYDALVKINGKEDPLRKTLLIIDEAHKLYGGDDLSSLERPDMNVLQQALNYSYEYSGKDSVKLLLMTATPITKDPMELIKLINLCKPANEQMPSDFTNFSEKYLNDNGEFTEEGRMEYLDDIAGYISYLNRDKDARQFAQPQIHHIKAPVISDIKIAERFDKKMVQDFLETDVSDLKEQIQEENKKLEGELGQVNAAKFTFLRDEICGDLIGKPKTICTKVVNANIRDMVIEAKDQLKDTREKIKEIREQIKEREKMKKTAMAEVKENIEKYPEQFEKYKNSLLYELKDKCAIKVGKKSFLDENIHKHPVIHKYDLEIQKYNAEITNLHEQLKQYVENYKKRMEHLKTMLTKDINELEKSVVRKTIRDEHREFTTMVRMKKKEVADSEKVLKSEITTAEKKRSKRFQRVKNTIKNMVTNEKERIRNFKQEKKMLRKTLKHQQKDIKHDFLKDLVNKYRSKILSDLVDADEGEHHRQIEREEQEQNRNTRKQEREQNRQTRKQQQEEQKILKQQEKGQQKQLKQQEKEREQQMKQQEKQRQQQIKQQERETKKQKKEQNKKTRKNT